MKRTLVQALVLVLLSGVAAVGVHFWHPMAPAWYLVETPAAEDEVTVDKVRGEFGGKVLWLDARPEEQYVAGHIPEAKLLNEQGFNEQLFELIDVLQKNTLPVVIYCGGEKCEASRKIKERLVEALPMENVWVLKGGWPAWKAAEGE